MAERHCGDVFMKQISIQHYVIELAIARWFSPGTLVSSTIKTDGHDITEILLNNIKWR